MFLRCRQKEHFLVAQSDILYDGLWAEQTFNQNVNAPLVRTLNMCTYDNLRLVCTEASDRKYSVCVPRSSTRIGSVAIFMLPNLRTLLAYNNAPALLRTDAGVLPIYVKRPREWKCKITLIGTYVRCYVWRNGQTGGRQ